MQRHHAYPRKWRYKNKGTTEIKMVEGKKHRAYHLLCGDMHPIEALKYIVENFLPSNIEVNAREL